MKYFRILNDTTVLFAESILSQKGLDKLKSMTTEALEIEEVDRNTVKDFAYYYVPASDFGPGADDRCGERNVFHDHNGNEYHN